jgi:uncharacterized ParB-like nuclease family protein
VSFTKVNGEWQMTAPVHARADFTTVDGLVSRLNGLQMKSIVAPEAAKLADYGLDKPDVSVELGAGSSKATLLMGKTAGEGAVNAKDQSRPAVFTVESALVGEMSKDPGDYRQKDLFDARAFNSTRVEIVSAGQTLTFEKTKTKNKEGQDEEKWRQTTPTARDIDPTKVDNLISAITATRANSFVESAAKTGLDKPEAVVTIKSDEGKREEKVTFAKSGTDAYAARAGEPGVAKVDASSIDNIAKSLEALK